MKSKDRVPALDGFRGVALVMVMFYHLGARFFTEEVVGKLPSKLFYLGASGVDLFFVLSGFLITGILVDQKQKTSRYFFRFYARRSLRIFPIYFIVLFVVLIVFPTLFGIRTITETIRANPIHLWIYTTNLWVSWENDWCFGALNHFWSLAIEEQFYLFWPVVVFALSTRRLLRLCIVAFLIFAIVRICCSMQHIGDATEKSFTLFRMDGLLLGSIAAMMVRSIHELNSYHARFRWYLIVLAGLFAGSLVFGANDFTVRYSLMSGVGMSLLLSTLASPSDSIENRILESKWLQSFGKYSYAMYVFQGPLVAILSPYLDGERILGLGSQPLMNAAISFTAMFAVTYGLAVLSWNYVESPFLRLRRHWSDESETKYAIRS